MKQSLFPSPTLLRRRRWRAGRTQQGTCKHRSWVCSPCFQRYFIPLEGLQLRPWDGHSSRNRSLYVLACSLAIKILVLNSFFVFLFCFVICCFFFSLEGGSSAKKIKVLMHKEEPTHWVIQAFWNLNCRPLLWQQVLFQRLISSPSSHGCMQSLDSCYRLVLTSFCCHPVSSHPAPMGWRICMKSEVLSWDKRRKEWVLWEARSKPRARSREGQEGCAGWRKRVSRMIRCDWWTNLVTEEKVWKKQSHGAECVLF